MPNIPAVLEKADFDALDPKVQEYFGEKDGKFYPNFSQSDVEKLAVGLRANKDAILKEKQTLEAELAKYKEHGTPDDLVTKFSEFETKLSEKGTLTEKELADKHKQDLEALKATHKTTIENLMNQQKAREGELLNHVSSTKLSAEISEAIAKAGGKPQFLQPTLEKMARVVEVKEGDQTRFVTQVLDSKGEPRYADALGTLFSVENLVSELANDKEWSDAFHAQNKGNGGIPGRQAQNFGGGILVDREASKSNPRLYQEAKAQAEKTGAQIRFTD